MAGLPLSVLDLAMVPAGHSSSDALAATTSLARHAEELGFHRFWVAEHHNMETVASPTLNLANPPGDRPGFQRLLEVRQDRIEPTQCGDPIDERLQVDGWDLILGVSTDSRLAAAAISFMAENIAIDGMIVKNMCQDCSRKEAYRSS